MRKSVLLVLCAAAAIAVSTASPRAQSGLAFSTTFNCPDWNQTMGGADQNVCAPGDGIDGWGAWTTSKGTVDSITSAANFPGGGGGKGLRHMRGDGGNNNGGGIRIVFPSRLNDLWIRFYMRYQSGFGWEYDQPHYTKDLYVNVNATNQGSIFTIGFHNGYFGVGLVNPGSMNLVDTSRQGGWQDINRGTKGDGQWHAYETHVKMDTNGSNGIAESWVDGILVHRHTNVNWGGSTGWHGFEWLLLGSNQNKVINNGVEMYTDYDDVAVSGTGYIGPIGGGQSSSSGAPSAPVNLRIVP
jgi:hypothetical protein